MRSQRVRLFQTLPHSCGYYRQRRARNLVLDPADPHLATMYSAALARGFRRAGSHVYQPQCPQCQACIACRVPVTEFMPNRSQRRCLRRNRDLSVRAMHPGLTGERYQLYARYLRSRHPGGGMDDARVEDFSRFLAAPWSPTVFLEFRHGETLLAVAVTDVSDNGLSAIYTFYEPDQGARSLGTYAVLRQIELARQRDLDYLYLGYWIAGHPKMDYKRRFRPFETLIAGVWQR